MKLDETNTVFPGARNYVKGSASVTPYTLRETVIGGQTVQVKVYDSMAPLGAAEYDEDTDYTIDADSITGVEANEH